MTTLEKIQAILPTLPKQRQVRVLSFIKADSKPTYYSTAPQYVRDSIHAGMEEIRQGKGIDGKIFFRQLRAKINRTQKKSALQVKSA
jgi:hypothetical protein